MPCNTAGVALDGSTRQMHMAIIVTASTFEKTAEGMSKVSSRKNSDPDWDDLIETCRVASQEHNDHHCHVRDGWYFYEACEAVAILYEKHEAE